MMTVDNDLKKSLHDLRIGLIERGHEIDAVQLKRLLEALHQLYTSTVNLSIELEGLARNVSKIRPGPRILYVVK